MNVHKQEANKALKEICKFLNFNCKSELVVDNDQNFNHCKDTTCIYLKTSPSEKQPCTCLNKKYIRVVNINENSKQTDLCRLYYQLGHEIGHQYFNAMEINSQEDETLACYLSIVCVLKFVQDRGATNYIKTCIESEEGIYKYAMRKAFEAYQTLDGTLDKETILNFINTDEP